MRKTLALAMLAAACQRDASPAPTPTRYELGRTATPGEIRDVDTDVGSDGMGLPGGSGTVARGEQVYAAQCASCHGAHGEGNGSLYPPLIGRDPRAEGFVFGSTPGLPRTIGNYWPYATTVFDYVRRAMPLAAPGSLSNDDVYAVTAYLLAANDIIPKTSTLDSATLSRVKMPYVDRFVPAKR